MEDVPAVNNAPAVAPVLPGNASEGEAIVVTDAAGESSVTSPVSDPVPPAVNAVNNAYKYRSIDGYSSMGCPRGQC